MTNQIQTTAPCSAGSPALPALCSGQGQFDTRKPTFDDGRPNPKAAQPWLTINWSGLRYLLDNPQTVAKADAYWCIPSSYIDPQTARSFEAQRRQGQFWWLPFDIDKGNPSLSDINAAINAIWNPEVERVIYSTKSATDQNRKWRGAVRMNAPLIGEDYTAYQSAIFDAFEHLGIVCDRALIRPGQVFYLPNRGEHYESHHEGHRGASPKDHPQMTARASEYLALEKERETHTSDPKKDGARSHLGAFRRKHHDTEALLNAYGFTQERNGQWRWPGQESKGSLDVHPDGGWSTLSGTAAQSGCGRVSRNGESTFGDAFDLYVHFQCGGNCDLAKSYAGQCLKEENDARYGDATSDHGKEVLAGLLYIGGRRIIDKDTWELESPLESIQLLGLAKDIAEVVYQAGDRDTQIFANAAGLAAVSALAAPFYKLQTHQDEFVSLNLYLLVLGPTGSGKEAIRSATRMALQAAGRGDEFLDTIGSFSALQSHLAEPEGGQAPGAVTLAIDEAGIALKTINKSSMGHQQMLIQGLMRLFGLGFGTLPKHKVRDKSAVIPAVNQPRTNLLWTSTPGKFVDAVGAEDSESGQLNRFLASWVEKMPPKRAERARRSLLQGGLPHQIQFKCAMFQYEPSEAHHPDRAPDRIIRTTTAALALIDEFEAFVEANHIQNQDAIHAESWVRAVEQLKKVAGVLAVGEGSLECDEIHVRVARAIVEASVGGIAQLADRSATKHFKPDTWEKVLAHVEKHKAADGWVEASSVLRGPLKHHDSRNDIVAQMIEAGELDEKREGVTKPKRFLRVPID